MAEQWYYLGSKGRLGPVSAERLQALAAQGELTPETLVWKQGLANWQPASDVPGLLGVPRTSRGRLPPAALTARARSGALPVILSVLALLVGSLALFLALYRDPIGPVYRLRGNLFGSGLEAYDFSTPAAALKSQLQMEYNRDIRAAMEFSRRIQEKDLKDKIDSLEIMKEKDVKLPEKDPPEKDGKTRDIKLLFIKFKEKGETRYTIEGFEKHADSGFWNRSYVSPYLVEKSDKELAKDMREWEERDKKK